MSNNNNKPSGFSNFTKSLAKDSKRNFLHNILSPEGQKTFGNSGYSSDNSSDKQNIYSNQSFKNEKDDTKDYFKPSTINKNFSYNTQTSFNQIKEVQAIRFNSAPTTTGNKELDRVFNTIQAQMVDGLNDIQNNIIPNLNKVIKKTNEQDRNIEDLKFQAKRLKTIVKSNDENITRLYKKLNQRMMLPRDDRGRFISRNGLFDDDNEQNNQQNQNNNSGGIPWGKIAGGLGGMAAMKAAGLRLAPIAAGAAIHFLDKDDAIGNWVNKNIPGAAKLDEFSYNISGGLVGTKNATKIYNKNNSKDIINYLGSIANPAGALGKAIGSSLFSKSDDQPQDKEQQNDININSKEAVEIKSINSVNIQTRSLKIKARDFDLDVENLTLSYAAKRALQNLLGQSSNDFDQDSAQPKLSQNNATMYKEDVQKYGLDKANQIADIRENPISGPARSLYAQITGQDNSESAARAIGTKTQAQVNQSQPQGQVKQSTTGNFDLPSIGDTTKVKYNRFSSTGVDPSQEKQNIVEINTPYGKANVHKSSASAYQGFFNEMKEMGAPLKTLGSYNVRQKRAWLGGRGWSEHSFGNAIDMDNTVGWSPAMKKWLEENDEKFQNLKTKYGMKQGIKNDPNHIEFGGVVTQEGYDRIKKYQEDSKGQSQPQVNQSTTASNQNEKDQTQQFLENTKNINPFLKSQQKSSTEQDRFGREKQFGQTFSDNPQLKNKMFAIALQEVGTKSESSQRAIMETMLNRSQSRDIPIDKILNPKYYAGFVGVEKGYQQLQNPKVREQLERAYQAVLKGSNDSNFATDNASAGVAANSMKTSTFTKKTESGESLFRKDQSPNIHGTGVVKKDKEWFKKVSAPIEQSNQEAVQEKNNDIPDAKPISNSQLSKDAGINDIESSIKTDDKNKGVADLVNTENRSDWNWNWSKMQIESNKPISNSQLSKDAGINDIPDAKPIETPVEPKIQAKNNDMPPVAGTELDDATPKNNDKKNDDDKPTQTSRKESPISNPSSTIGDKGPEPGSDGYGNQKQNADNSGGICAI